MGWPLECWDISTAFLYARLFGDRDTDLGGNHGQSSEECNEAVFTDPAMLAARHQLGKNPDIYDDEVFRMHEAPPVVQEVWRPFMQFQFVRSCIICTNVGESGVTVASVGLVMSSGVQRRVSTDIRTGATVNALQTLSKAQVTQQQWEDRKD